MSRRSPQRGPGSNQWADKPPLPPRDATGKSDVSVVGTADDPFAGDGPDAAAYDPGPWVGSVGLTDPDRFCDAFLPSQNAPTWDLADTFMERTDAGRPDAYAYTDLDDLADTLENDGFYEPVKVHGTFVVDGHHRVAAARRRGLPIPYERVEDDLADHLPRSRDDWTTTHGPVAATLAGQEFVDQWPDDAAWSAQVDEALATHETLHFRDELDEPYWVSDAQGDQHQVHPGVLDDNARRVFLNGHCHSLAVAVWQRTPDDTGWDLAAMRDPNGDIVHVLVSTPDGLYLDIDNAHTADSAAETYPAAYGNRPEPVDVSEIVDLGMSGYFADGLETGIASTFVAPVLRRGGYDPDTWQARR